MSGRRLALLAVLGAGLIALLRTILVPVGSFREGLDRLRFGMTAESVRDVLGDPTVVCSTASVDHLDIEAADTAFARDAVRATTTERWIYSRSRPGGEVRRDPGVHCRAPVMATELGFDSARRLRWYVREMQQTPAEIDSALLAR